jgi:hypothetical protein
MSEVTTVREGKCHAYEVLIDGRFVGYVRRALIGVWVATLRGGSGLKVTFQNRDAAVQAVVNAVRP